MKLTFGVILSLWACLALAEPAEEARDNAFINVNMTLELDGIEGAIQDTRQSLDQVGVALNSIAQSGNLNDEQQQLLTDTVDNLNQLVVLSKQSVVAMPGAFEHSRQTVATESERFLNDLRSQILLVVGVIGLVIVLVIAAIAWLILRPMQETLVRATQNISSMAGAIKTTAQALDSISSQQQEISKRLELVGDHNGDNQSGSNKD
ncbi:hypothetical protein OPW36_18575 [Vibrio europaeus]|uniref:GTP-binding protein n=1 Tax=Vibrio europaeus TaxID=300876 RepID=A0AAE7B2L4_9VIBR|nr:hypothetical protein [Vibrio europaeus]MDC5805191.1 hypothetical protein [Vibrio europaeus]MDC5826734.1 hypothetical protein [Vibrio europaeus]MDC5832100.1 hypothetical protein [Vibrio europaeus]MDC5835055.1 hypothetical protein [Vibrio europaeus]QJY39506.1 hypothetical protein HOO69_23605 [Vibrio europaeus]